MGPFIMTESSFSSAAEAVKAVGYAGSREIPSLRLFSLSVLKGETADQGRFPRGAEFGCKYLSGNKGGPFWILGKQFE